MTILIRASNAIQLWCLLHPNFLSRAVLSVFNSVEVIRYASQGQAFLTRRVELFGPNFAAVGKLIVGEHRRVVELLAAPQQRGVMIGQARFVEARMPRAFPLFMSDEGATGGTGVHAAVHGAIWDRIALPAQERLSSPVLTGIIEELVTQLKGTGRQPAEADIRPAVQRMVVRYMMFALFGVDCTPAQVDALYNMFYGSSPFSSYILSRAKPFAPPVFLLGDLREQIATIIAAIVASPALADYQPDPATESLSSSEWAQLLLSIVGVAAFGGGGNLAVSVIADIPAEFDIKLDDRVAVFRAVLEAARVNSPVGNFNVITEASSEYEVAGKTLSFPKGTLVAGTISVASVDPVTFPDPLKFDPSRDNLTSGFVNFNGVGFDADQDTSRRTCPGRNVAVGMCSSLLVAWRHARPAA